MNKPTDEKDQAEIADSIRNSELKEGLEALVLEFRREATKSSLCEVQCAWNDAAVLLEKVISCGSEPEGKNWCCTVEADEKIPNCVIDYNNPSDCVHAPKHNKREDCPFWKLV